MHAIQLICGHTNGCETFSITKTDSPYIINGLTDMQTHAVLNLLGVTDTQFAVATARTEICAWVLV